MSDTSGVVEIEISVVVMIAVVDNGSIELVGEGSGANGSHVGVEVTLSIGEASGLDDEGKFKIELNSWE